MGVPGVVCTPGSKRDPLPGLCAQCRTLHPGSGCGTGPNVSTRAGKSRLPDNPGSPSCPGPFWSHLHYTQTHTHTHSPPIYNPSTFPPLHFVLFHQRPQKTLQVVGGPVQPQEQLLCLVLLVLPSAGPLLLPFLLGLLPAHAPHPSTGSPAVMQELPLGNPNLTGF